MEGHNLLIFLVEILNSITLATRHMIKQVFITKSPIKNIQEEDLDVCSKIPYRKGFHKVMHIEA
jgi:hypothetical protein